MFYKTKPNIWLFYVILILLTWLYFLIHYFEISIFRENISVMLTMLFGSFIAGASSEGGGAIAFPVFTLALKLSPDIARNFSLLIQSVGMTSASLFIIQNKIPIEKKIIGTVSISGILGFIISSYFLIDLFKPSLTKLAFVSIWLGFAFIFWVHKNSTNFYLLISKTKDYQILILTGLLGGIISAFFGNGIDILSFSILVLYFNLSEKVATPTSIILMAIISIFGMLFHFFILKDVTPKTIDYWMTSIPIVIFFAPIGAHIINITSRQFIRLFLISIIIIQYIGAIIVIKPTLKEFSFSFILGVITLFIFYKIYKSKSKV